MSGIISVENVSKTYESERGSVAAIKGFSMEIGAGDFVAIVGPSGCGKTTLLWGLTGLHPFSSGKAMILGKEVSTPRREVGIIFQQSNLLPWRTILQNIHFPLEIMRENLVSRRDHIMRLIESTGLKGFENAYPIELSGGMQQRASIVRALSYDPQILLMDEPFGALDAYTRDEMDALLLELWEKTKKTIVFVTHRIEEAVFLADSVLVMTPRPGENSAQFSIDLPRPRPAGIQMEQRFFDIVTRITKKISQDVEAQKKQGTYRSQAFSTVT